jgi:ribosomal protein S18 acetylase RimI-like enzyme
MGRTIFEHQHGSWRDDYRRQVPQLHRPADGKHVAVAEAGTTETGAASAETADARPTLLGYVAWNIDDQRHHGEIDILAVAADHRGAGAGRQLCEHAFAAMKADGIRVVEIGTGGDPFHAPARALYEDLGCTPLPATVYFKEL